MSSDGQHDDIFDSHEWDVFVNQARERAIRPMADSAFVASIIPGSEPDVKVCLEIGAAVWLDKPIFAVAIPGRPVPENMRRLATYICEADPDTSEGQEKIGLDLKWFMEEYLPDDGGSGEHQLSSSDGSS